MASTLIISAIPYYLVALLAYLYFVLQWGIFSETSYVPLTEDPVGWAGALALPWLVLTVYFCVTYARFSRGSMIESLSEDYVRTARAMGVVRARSWPSTRCGPPSCRSSRSSASTSRHCCPGTVFTEAIFGINGIGRTALASITQGDLPIISATVLIGSIFIVLANLLVDIVYSFLDPSEAVVTTVDKTMPASVVATNAAKQEPFLVVEDLTVQFPTHDGLVQAVTDLSYAVDLGETLGIVGESGSGKSVSSMAVLDLHDAKRSRLEDRSELPAKR